MAAVLPHPVDAETVLTDPVEVPDVSICTAESLQLRTDLVAPEEPLQIRLAGCDLSVTMRSPGDDFDLVIGFLLSEGIIDDSSQIASIRFCPDADGALSQNIVNVNLASSGHVQGIEPRPFRANSSCGVCGRTTIDDLLAQTSPLATGPLVSFQTLASLPALLSERQPLFHATGGIHAAGLFSHIGRLLVVREDIGRHNAVDKVIGHAARTGLDPGSGMLLVSGRVSFEVVQKALRAGIAVVAAVSAPSSLAVALARSAGMTLVGFLREGRCNIYAGQERVVFGWSETAGGVN